ncbi:MAG: phage major capsid protein [Candidatus Cloacimonetes bacterium]|nr:phage major capsid protein [Candidatus Cloacimonadota bacterium]
MKISQRSNNSTKKNGKSTREYQLLGIAEKEDPNVFEISFSSEVLVKRWFGNEVLDHERADFKFISSGRAPLLLDHDHTRQIGVIEDAWIDKKIGRARIRFSKNEETKPVIQDVRDGIKKNVSVGYEFFDPKVVDEREGVETYKVGFSPLEISIVSVPADKNVGFDRSQIDEKQEQINREIFQNILTKKDESIMPKETQDALDETRSKSSQVETRSQDPISTEKVELIKKEARAEAIQIEKKRVKDISDLAKTRNLIELGSKAIAEETTFDEFRSKVFDELETRYNNFETKETNSGLEFSKREKQQYSFGKIASAVLSGDLSRADLGLDVSQSLEKQFNKRSSGILIPFNAPMSGIAKRDQLAGTMNIGGAFVPEHLSTTMQDILRDQLITSNVGVTTLYGLSGHPKFPRKLSASSPNMVDENTAGNKSILTFDQVGMLPKKGTTYVEISDTLLLQSNTDFDRMVEQDLMDGVIQYIDDQFLNGDGVGNNIKGIKNITGVNTFVLGTANSPTYDEVVNMETLVASSKVRMENMSYITSPNIYGKLKTTSKDAGSGRFILENQRLNDYQVYRTTLVNNELIFGKWNESVLGFFGAIELLRERDPRTGEWVLAVHFHFDHLCRQPSAFTITTNV